MDVRLHKTTVAGIGSIAAGILGPKLGLDRDTQAQLITLGFLAITSRDTAEKILCHLRRLDGEKETEPKR